MKLTRVVEFYGGPWDGKVKAVETVKGQPFYVASPKIPIPKWYKDSGCPPSHRSWIIDEYEYRETKRIPSNSSAVCVYELRRTNA